MIGESVKNSTAQDTIGAVLVVGGGIGGIQASLDLADNGYKVYLVEEKPAIGGVMAQLDKTFPTNDCSLCILSPKLVDIGRHPNVTLLTNSEVANISGSAGNFSVSVNQKARYVTDDCVGCALCTEACVMAGRFTNEFDENLKKRGAIYIPYPQAVPLRYVVDSNDCLYLKYGKCSQKCMSVCGAHAIDFDQKDTIIDLNVGAVIMAPGYKVFNAENTGTGDSGMSSLHLNSNGSFPHPAPPRAISSDPPTKRNPGRLPGSSVSVHVTVPAATITALRSAARMPSKRRS